MKPILPLTKAEACAESEKQVLLEQIRAQEDMLARTTEYLMGIQAQLEVSKQVLFEQNKNLEHTVDVRTQELKKTVTRLQHEIKQREYTQQCLTVANNELNVLLYRSSHDFKGPVCTAWGLLSLLENKVQDPEAREYIQLLHRPLAKLEALTKTITSIADFRHNQVCIDKIDLESLLGKVLEQHQQRLDTQYPEVKSANTYKVIFRSDARFLESLLYHVLENAFQYRVMGRKHKVSICIQPYYKQLKIQVSDTGTGIPQNFQHRVFDMFFRGSELSTGSGLGLYLSKLAVEKLGGSISIKSEERRGTTVTVLLPNH